jgi:hypothetical protein
MPFENDSQIQNAGNYGRLDETCHNTQEKQMVGYRLLGLWPSMKQETDNRQANVLFG